jgi:hypothetical protein
VAAVAEKITKFYPEVEKTLGITSIFGYLVTWSRAWHHCCTGNNPAGLHPATDHAARLLAELGAVKQKIDERRLQG